MKSFEDKVAAITGAGSGIGRALAVELAKRRCNLALSDVNAAGLSETVDLVKSYPVKVTSQTVDVGKREEVHAWADQVVADHARCNLVFNNAGVALGATIEDVTYEEFEWIVQINFWGVVYGTKAFLPHLRASGDGHVINISSIFGLASVPLNGTYNATKFAVRGFTECLRMELEMTGAAVSATSVHPGGIKTNIARSARQNETSLRRLGRKDGEEEARKFERLFRTTPEDAAKTILRGVQEDRRRVLIGQDAVAFDLMARILPTGYQQLVMAAVRRSR